MEIRVLGPFEVLADGRTLPVPRGGTRSLLAVLALGAGRPVPVDVLVDRLWGEGAAPRHARQSLQNLVWRLRQVIGTELVGVNGEAYQLRIAPEQVDALRFGTLLDRAAHAGAAERQQLDDALALWRGEPLTGVDCEPLRRDWIPTLTERYLTGLERRCDLDLAVRGPSGLVAELRDLVARYPLRESLWGRLMTVLATSGRDAEALEAYEQVRRLVAERLGTDPSGELRELHQRLLAGERFTSTAPAAPVPTAEDAEGAGDQGQAGDPDGPPAGPRPVAVARQLPPRAPGFVGREAEHDRLTAMLDRVAVGAPVVIAVVHGAAGIGKTAFTVRWAHQMADRFPGGQFFLDLRGYGPGEPMPVADALSTLLRSVGYDPRRVQGNVDELAALWRTAVADSRVLVVLDNARDPDQVRPLLPGANAMVVVTSRSQLRGLSSRDGAHPVMLSELAGAEAGGLFDAAIGVWRTAVEPEATDALLALCGGSPLALRITADLVVRRSDQPLAELVSELRTHRLDAWADPDDATADPRVVISWSYRALPEDQARVFRRLALHPGVDFSAPCASALIGEDPAAGRRALERLAAVHLVEVSRPGRYRFHDLVREYAAERAAEDPADERDAAVRRLLDWYVHTANAANATAFGGAEKKTLVEPAEPIEPLRFGNSAEAVAWFETELPDLVAATRYAEAHGQLAHAWQLPWMCASACELNGWIDDWIAMAAVGHRAAASSGDRPRYLAAYTLGCALSNAYRSEEAQQCLLEALECARATGVVMRVVCVLNALGTAYHDEGDCESALRAWREGIATADAGSRAYAAHCRHGIGHCQINHGDVAEGIAISRAALAEYRELGAEFPQAMVLSNLADGHARTGALTEAVGCADEAMALFGRLRHLPAYPESLVPVARAYLAAGRPQAAAGPLRRVVEVYGGQRNPWCLEAERLLAECAVDVRVTALPGRSRAR